MATIYECDECGRTLKTLMPYMSREFNIEACNLLCYNKLMNRVIIKIKEYLYLPPIEEM